MKQAQWKKEEIAEDYCFICKDGGHLRVCDYRNCLKGYHPNCVGKDAAFLEADDHWTCDLHTCNCGESSSFHCFCCPTSYCQLCIKSAEFIQVRKDMGFCNDCLRLVKMIEEEQDVDSDGAEVDFCNTETYEFLFKDYYVLMKDQHKLTLAEVQAAAALLKGHENYKKESDSDKLSEEESVSGPEDLEDDSDDGKPVFKVSRGKRSRKKTNKKTCKKEKAFIGWASEALVKFLASIGRSTSEALMQVDVSEIIKEYVQSKNLFQPNKKRKNYVVPDEKLYALFRKKKLKYHKIFDLVKGHLAEEQSDPSDEGSLSSEEDEGSLITKKKRSSNLDGKIPRSEVIHCSKRVPKPSGSCYAAMTAKNIKQAYLKRSLMLELLKDFVTFEEKVVGCFVRIKNDPKSYDFLVQKEYQLGQVMGVKKTEQAYKIGETSTYIVLRVSNCFKDIKISMLSDDKMKEEECEDLRQLVKRGLFKQPTIEELQRKIKTIHKDIVNHWIDKKIPKLQKKIDRANEKGWRKELEHYIEKRQRLLEPEERFRLVEEIPEVIPDIVSPEADNDGPPNLHVEKIPDIVNPEAVDNGPSNLHEGNEDAARISAVFLENDAEGEAEGIEAVALAIESNADSKMEVAGQVQTGILGDSSDERSCNMESELKSKNSDDQVHEIKDGKELPSDPKTSNVEVIDLADDDDDYMAAVSKENDHAPLEDVDDVWKEKNHITSDDDMEIISEIVVPATVDASEAIWWYLDPSGNKQGPFKLWDLSLWKQKGYFDDDFKVWKTGQRQRDAILLTAALGLSSY